MILCVAANPALDVTYACDGPIRIGETNRVTPTFVAGGKAINAARILQTLGREVRVIAVIGGAVGREVVAGLEESGIDAIHVSVAGSTRRTTTFWDVSADSATLFSEPGPTVTEHEWDAFGATVCERLDGVEAVVCSGSLPPGAPDDGYARLIAAAIDQDIPVFVDTSGRALRPALAAGPTFVSPNRAEALELVDWDVDGPWSLGDVADALVAAGARSAAVTDGANGITASDGTGLWHAWSAPVKGNPTGAGDAALAGFVDAFLHGGDWPMRLERAVSCGAAAVASGVAGEFGVDPEKVVGTTVERLR